MASQPQKDTLPIAIVFSNLFRNFHRLILTNLLFAVPFGAFFSLFWLLTAVTKIDPSYSVLVLLITVIPSFPFYAGVVKVTAKISLGEEKVSVLNNFFSGVKDNFLRFLIHGVVFYIASVFSYVSVSLYIRLLSQSSLFVGPLIISIIVILFFVFMFFYIPSMTVTFDIPMKYIYKNSFLMSYGELKKNFIGLFGLFFLVVISTTLLIACYGSRVAVVIVTIVLAALIIPAVASFIINSAVYKGMYDMITDKAAQSKNIDKKIDEVKNKKSDTPYKDELLEIVKSFEPDDTISDDEYVYFNGKMMKQGVIKQMKQKAQEREES